MSNKWVEKDVAEKRRRASHRRRYARFNEEIYVMRLWSVSLMLLLASCASVQPQEFKGPSGKPAYSMKCSGMGRTLDDCYKKAGEVCPSGYNIIDRTSSVAAAPVSGGVLAAPQHHLAIECK